MNALGNTRYEISVARLWRAVRMATMAFIKETNDEPDEGYTEQGLEDPRQRSFCSVGAGCSHADIHSHGSTIAHEGVKPEKRC